MQVSSLNTVYILHYTGMKVTAKKKKASHSAVDHFLCMEIIHYPVQKHNDDMFPVQNDLKQADALLPLGRSRKTRWD
jgi:hypothetical protein